jgi:glycosyltransferase involved in cell wall biosynthesis
LWREGPPVVQIKLIRAAGRVAGRSVVGRLDEPRRASAGTTVITGWAVGLTSPVSSIHLLIDGQELGRAGLHRPRRDVGRSLTDDFADLSGFELPIPIRPWSQSTAVTLTASVRLLDGTVQSLPEIQIDYDATSVAAMPDVVASVPIRSRSKDPTGGIRLLCFARSLDHGGSQLRMLELLEFLVATPRFKVTVVSRTEGPLRADLQTAGIDVIVVPLSYKDLDVYESQLAAFAAWVDGRFDLVFGATLSSFPVINVAERLGLPSVWRIGEAEPLPVVLEWLGEATDPGVERAAYRAFRTASLVYFNSQAALDRYRRDGLDGRFIMLRTGIQVAPIAGFVAATDRLALRASLGLSQHRRVLVCVGTIWPVKGQAALVTAIAQMDSATRSRLQMVFVGSCSAPYFEAIRRFVDRHALSDSIRFVPFCDPKPWLFAADAAVCPSESESMPAAVIEAMAFGLPVLACRVGGLPEIVDEGVTGWLCEGSDVMSLRTGLERVMNASPEVLATLGDRGRRRVTREHDRAVILRETAELFEAVVEAPMTVPEPVKRGC